jgi:hypothetical protein
MTTWKLRALARSGAIAVASVALIVALGPGAQASGRSSAAPAASPAVVPCAGTACHVRLKYVTNTITIPSTAAQANTLAFDLNGDGHKDNALGQAFATLAAQNIDLQADFTSSINAGRDLMLHSLVARSLQHDAAATWQVFTAKSKRNPAFDGTGMFSVDPNTSRGSRLVGTLTNGSFKGGPGTVPFRMSLVRGQTPFDFQLVVARIAAHCTAAACHNGLLGGAIRMTDFNSKFYFALAQLFMAEIGPNCTASTPGNCTTQAQQLLQLFDTNDDYVITAQELQANAIMQSLFAPDLDLYKADGKRGKDGVADSISLGIGFSSVRAKFTLP